MKTPPIIQVKVIISEPIPGAAFSLNNVPNNNPRPINIIAEGIITKIHTKTLLILNVYPVKIPINPEYIKVIML